MFKSNPIGYISVISDNVEPFGKYQGYMKHREAAASSREIDRYLIDTIFKRHRYVRTKLAIKMNSQSLEANCQLNIYIDMFDIYYFFKILNKNQT